MSRFLCITVTFLQPVYHGRIKCGRAGEWPPSPMRLFQALVAGAFRGRPAALPDESALEALRWMERREPPTIIACQAREGNPYKLFVPNNDSDIIASAWAKGAEPSKSFAELKTAKDVRPHYLGEPDQDGLLQVRFLWALDGECDSPEALTLCELARRVLALGWGMDLVACDGCITDSAHADDLEIRWQPDGTASGARNARRVPVPGSLKDLQARHSGFLNAYDDSNNSFNNPPPVKEFREVLYRRESATAARPFAAFALRPISGDAQWRAFRQERANSVAGMLRHRHRSMRRKRSRRLAR